jgi:voltage-gated potassium channel
VPHALVGERLEQDLSTGPAHSGYEIRRAASGVAREAGGLAPERRRGDGGGLEPLGVMWTQDESGHVRTPFEPLILGATLAMIPVIIIERDARSEGWRMFGQVANWMIWGIFAIELLTILIVAPRKLDALRAHWLDAAIVVVTVPFYGKLLSSLRLVRLARLLRLLRAGVVLGRALQAERRLTSANAFRFVAIATTFLVFIAGAVQATIDTGDFRSFWDGLWWAVVTVTTVGYGDINVTTVPGRMVAMALMLLGIGFVAVLTATIASRFVQSDTRSHEEELRDSLARIERELKEIKAQLDVG